jgi:CheY-like chemotaxis protein
MSQDAGVGDEAGSAGMVLLVEDDPDLREDLAYIVRSLGFPVTTAVHGAMALDALRRGLRPALILLDLMMPVMDGWSLRSELLRDRRLAHIPVVVLSGVMEAERQARMLAADDCLPKPIEIEELKRILAIHCGPTRGGDVGPPRSP